MKLGYIMINPNYPRTLSLPFDTVESIITLIATYKDREKKNQNPIKTLYEY